MHDAGAPGMQYLYMGFYIHSCVKMRYKGEYAPSYLLDPEEYTWHPLEECTPLLDKYRYASFAHPEHSTDSKYGEASTYLLIHVRHALLTSIGCSRDAATVLASKCTIFRGYGRRRCRGRASHGRHTFTMAFSKLMAS